MLLMTFISFFRACYCQVFLIFRKVFWSIHCFVCRISKFPVICDTNRRWYLVVRRMWCSLSSSAGPCDGVQFWCRWWQTIQGNSSQEGKVAFGWVLCYCY